MAGYRLLIKRSAARQWLPSGIDSGSFGVLQRSTEPRPSACEKLSGAAAKYRIRQGDHRIVYAIDDAAQIVEIVKVGYRREVYRQGPDPASRIGAIRFPAADLRPCMPAKMSLLHAQSRCLGADMRLYLVFIQSCEAAMRYSSQVKPISYLKANAAEVLLQLAEQREPLVITQNGEAKAVIQDVASYEETQETLALLKILALGNQEIEAGKVEPVANVVARLRTGRTAE